MSNYDRICFIAVPDKNNLIHCSKYDSSDFMAAILNFMFYKKKHKDESSTSAQISPEGNQPSIIKTEKKLSAKVMLVAVSLRYPLFLLIFA